MSTEIKSPFDIFKSISYTKNYIDDDNILEEHYNAFIINRALSFFNDSIIESSLMNICNNLDIRLQYDFYYNLLRKRNRYSGKWPKLNNKENIEIISNAYNISKLKAKEALEILSNEQLDILKQTKNGVENDFR